MSVRTFLANVHFWVNYSFKQTNGKATEYKKRTKCTYINVYYWPQSSQCRKAPQILEPVILHTNSVSSGNIWTCLENKQHVSIWCTVLIIDFIKVFTNTYVLLNTPRISKIMSSNIVQEKANVTEKTTCTTYCRIWGGIETYLYYKYWKPRVNTTGLNLHLMHNTS